MSDDIFESISNLERKADEIVEHARQQARAFRDEVETTLKALAEELERDYGKQREDVEEIVAEQRKKLFAEFEMRLREGLEKLEKVKREKVAPLVEQVVKAFLESTHGN